MKLARIVLSLLITLSLLFSTAHPIFAQTQQEQKAREALNVNNEVPLTIHTWVQTVMFSVMSGTSCLLTGEDPFNSNGACLGYDQTTGKIGYVDNHGGLVGVMGNMITMLFTPPINTSDYFAYVKSGFIVKDANAQGIGLTSLGPLAKVWATFRDMVYLIFVLAFVIIGLGIMLRYKIDSKTVMTMQNQIPKVIIGLLLVTFSLAIAGLLIDLMYLAIYLIFNVLGSTDLLSQESQNRVSVVQQTFNGKNAIQVFNDIVSFPAITSEVSGSVGNLIGQLFTTGDNSVGNFGELLKNGVGGFLGLFAGWIAYLIIAIALIFALFRVWIQLLKSYVYFLLDVIFAPFWIITGVFNGPGFGGWIRDMLAHLSAFPVTIAMFLLALVIKDALFSSQGTLFVPPLIGNSGNLGPLGAIISLGIILTTPEVVQITKDAFKSPELKYGKSIGQSLGIGQAGIGNIGSKGWKRIYSVNPYDHQARGAFAGFLAGNHTGVRGMFSRVVRTVTGATGVAHPPPPHT